MKENIRFRGILKGILGTLAVASLGYFIAEIPHVNDYLAWREQNIITFHPVGDKSLLGTIIRESTALSAYKHRNDKKDFEDEGKAIDLERQEKRKNLYLKGGVYEI